MTNFSLPIPSEELIAVHHIFPVLWVFPPRFLDSNSVIAFLLHDCLQVLPSALVKMHFSWATDLAIFLGGTIPNSYVTILRCLGGFTSLVSLLLHESQHGKLHIFLLRKHFNEKDLVFGRKQRYKEEFFSKYSSNKYNLTIEINFLKYIHLREIHIILLLFLCI